MILYGLRARSRRLVKYVAPVGSNQIEITDPRKYLPVPKVSSWEDMEKNIMEIGRKVKRKEEIDKLKRDKRGLGKVFYLYIPGNEQEPFAYRETVHF